MCGESMIDHVNSFQRLNGIIVAGVDVRGSCDGGAPTAHRSSALVVQLPWVSFHVRRRVHLGHRGSSREEPVKVPLPRRWYCWVAQVSPRHAYQFPHSLRGLVTEASKVEAQESDSLGSSGIERVFCFCSRGRGHQRHASGSSRAKCS